MRRYLFATALVFLCAAEPSTLAAASSAPVGPVEVQILAINDFHGNLDSPANPQTIVLNDGSKLVQRVGGASALSATIKRLRSGHRQTITVSAGDLIGASPLVSAYFLDEPTIQAMNELGLQLNAVGNHEFDKGHNELLRMQRGGCEKYTSREPCRVEPFKGARFSFLAANVLDSTGLTIFPATAIRQFGPVKIGFIGMTLTETRTLVTPAGVAGLTFEDEAKSANELVPKLKAAGADAIVLLIHHGGRTPQTFRESGCPEFTGPILDIMDRLDPAISVIVSGHTHQAYACRINRGGADRLLTSAGRYGNLVTDIRLQFDRGTLAAKSAHNVPVRPELGEDGKITALVQRYAAAAAPAAARVVGKLHGPALKSETDEEGTAGDLIADAQLAATWPRDRGGADISFINAPGIRTSLIPHADGTVTYGKIFAVQPFGNNLVVKPLTGAQLKAALEQQFNEEDGRGQLGSLLIPSGNFRFTYDMSLPKGQRITAMTLDRKPIDLARRYRVTVNNFLASGGDGFSVFADVSEAFDAGLDLDALEAYLARTPSVAPDRIIKVTATSR